MKKLLALILTVMLAFSCFNAVLARIDASAFDYDVPEGYCENDYVKLRTYLDYSGEDGTALSNGEKLSSYFQTGMPYDPNDPQTWAGVTWIDTDNGKMIDTLYLYYCEQLGMLDVSGCTALTLIACEENQLSGISVNGCSALSYMSCNVNRLVYLDISNTPSLTTVDCSNNQLSEIIFGNDSAVSYLNCTNNVFTELDLTPCHDLDYIDCSNNSIASINFSISAPMSALYCANNELKALDLSLLPMLATLDCSDNALSDIDVSICPMLETLYCNANNLNTLDVSNNQELFYLECKDNNMSELTIGYKPWLSDLNCSGNQLTSLDIHGCETLYTLDCTNNLLTDLELDDYLGLGELLCGGNYFTDIHWKHVFRPEDTEEIVSDFEVTLHAEEGGFVSVGKIIDPLTYETEIVVFASADPEHRFIGWYDVQGNCVSPAANYRTGVNDFGTVELDARFVPNDTPQSEGWYFESDPFGEDSQHWMTIDNDGDGYNWGWVYDVTGAFLVYEGNGIVSSQSSINYVGPITPDNWLISPLFEAGEALTFRYAGQDPNYANENFGIYISLDGGETWSEELGYFTSDSMYKQGRLDTSAYEGQMVMAAFRHYNSTGMFMLNLDAVEIVCSEQPPITEEPITEEPVTEEPTTEEPITEEPVTEDPITEEPITEEPITEEPSNNPEPPTTGTAAIVGIGIVAVPVGISIVIFRKKEN